ncbi:hypothetical protein F9Z43_06605 [Pseudomonas monteilii]|uniref:Uncharacterized protein n=1 Tax=Pseudomonas monteilii TaxID=76759 RepID=A0A7X3F0B5_9PSED|nr:hypothetical protein [Pseudomonas monteilii]MVF49006.1 hypothetical protein [Pseudomonas monteilii]
MSFRRHDEDGQDRLQVQPSGKGWLSGEGGNLFCFHTYNHSTDYVQPISLSKVVNFYGFDGSDPAGA